MGSVQSGFHQPGRDINAESHSHIRCGYCHPFQCAKFVASRLARKLETESLAGNVKNAFLRNTRPIRSLFHPAPAGWSSRSRRILAGVVGDASRFVQTMNDRFTNPSGIIEESPQAEMLKVVDAEDEPQVEQAKSSADSAN